MLSEFSNKITPGRFSKYILPSVVLELVFGLYYTLDTLFVSIFVGKTALATMSIAYPVIGVMWGITIMLSCGSSALVAMDMGAGRQELADRRFTTTIVLSLLLSFILIAFCFSFLDPICGFLGAQGDLKEYCKDYLGILIWCFPAAFIQTLFEYYIRVDGHPTVTLVLSLLSGGIHMVVDIVFMGVFKMGIAGAAYGTLIGSSFAAIAGVLYFLFKSTNLKIRKPIMDWRFIGHTFANGSSEFVNQSSEGINTYFFNIVMLNLAGEDGVAAISVAFSIHYLFISIHVGYTVGIEPLISYFYGAEDYKTVNRFLHYTRKWLIGSAIVIPAVFLVFAPFLAGLYADPGTHVYDMSVYGIRLLASSFIVSGFTIFGGGFFTAYGNGGISALISCSRTLVAIIFFLYLLSALFGVTGLWLATFAAEAATAVMTVMLLRKYRKRYHFSFK